MKINTLSELEKAATHGPWNLWVVTTSAQECPDGKKRPLAHGAAPPHQMDVGDKMLSINLAAKDGELIAALRNAAPHLIAMAKATKAAFEAENCRCESANCIAVRDALAALEKEP